MATWVLRRNTRRPRTSRLPVALLNYRLFHPITQHRNTNPTTQVPQDEPESIAVLGGGITGLAATYYASVRFPSASITLFEASEHLGGVIESVRLPISHCDGSTTTMLCEKGPRTLRANAPRAIVTFDLVHALGLATSLLTVPLASLTASTRYIFYPSRPVALPAFNPRLTRRHIAAVPAPSSLGPRRLLRVLWIFLTEPLFAGVWRGILHDVFVARRPGGGGRTHHNLRDESVWSFVSRRWGREVADNLVSPILHGLYAGDLYSLSVKATMPSLWELEKRAEERRQKRLGWCRFGGVLGELLRDTLRETKYDESGEDTLNPSPSKKMSAAARAKEREAIAARLLREGPAGVLEDSLRDVSVFSFKDGIGQLPAALEKNLRARPNVEFVMGTEVTGIAPTEKGVSVSVKKETGSRHFTHTIATMPLSRLLSTIQVSSLPDTLSAISVTVMHVTLCYASAGLNDPYRGFGYLFPRSVPRHLNPECALGVVFDSDAMPGQDNGPNPGTKISVIMGGHWWDGRSENEYPSEAESVSMAKRLLERQLGITDEPIRTLASLRRDSIPQYTAGHYDRMARLHELLLQMFDGRLRVAGKSYRGIGVHDCIFSARSVVDCLDYEAGMTGLEQFVEEDHKSS